VLKDADVGLAEVQLLSGWRRSSNVPGMMQAADPLRRRSLLVISEALDDFTDEMDLREYSRRTVAAWTGAGPILELHGPEEWSPD
jgi:hypothetical protein